MPTWSPPFGTPPFPMLSAELLMVEFEADREEIERITPALLEHSPPGLPAPAVHKDR